MLVQPHTLALIPNRKNVHKETIGLSYKEKSNQALDSNFLKVGPKLIPKLILCTFLVGVFNLESTRFILTLANRLSGCSQAEENWVFHLRFQSR